MPALEHDLAVAKREYDRPTDSPEGKSTREWREFWFARAAAPTAMRDAAVFALPQARTRYAAL